MPSSLPLPRDYEDKATIVALANRLLEQGQHQRYLLERDAYRNCLFDLGVHWITFDERLRTYIPTPTKRWAPKPVTNKFSSTARTIVSQFAGEEPNLYLSPMTDAAEDIATAQVGSRALDVAYRETGFRTLRSPMARWFAITGNVFAISGYDRGQSTGMTTVQNFQCPACGQDASPLDWQQGQGACPMCGAQAQPRPSRDEFNAPRVTQFPRGRLYTDLGAVFECFADLRAQYLDKSPWFQWLRTVSRNHLLDQYGPVAETVSGSGSGAEGSRIRWFLESLAYATQSAASVTSGKLTTDDDRVYCKTFWYEHPQFPQGLHAVIAGGQVLEAGPFPYHTLDSDTAPPDPAVPPKPNPVMKPLREVVHFGYQYVPGRLMYRTPADDVAGKNVTRNKLEAFLLLHMRRSANTVWVVPDGSSITKVSGEEGIVIRYSPLAGGQPPQRQAGSEAPATLWQYMAEIDKEIEDLWGTYDVMRGETPRGVRAAMALQLLEQRGQQGLSEPLVNWSLGHQRWAEQILGIFKEYGVDERFQSALGDNGLWAVQKFTNADLRGAVRVEVEAGLGRPRTQVGKRAVYQQAVAMGLVNPMDPQERHRGLQILGMPELSKDLDMDIQAAARENDAWLVNDAALQQMQQPPKKWPAVRTGVDNAMVHLATHRRLAISDKWDTLLPIVQDFILGHIQATVMMVQATLNPQVAGQGIPGSARTGAKGMGQAGGEGERASLQEGQGSSYESRPQLGSRAEMVGSGESGRTRGD